MASYDQLGSFYLGRRHELSTGQTSSEPLVYRSKDLTTHAVCVGMTGSGKTGLCLSLLEEAAIDGIPAIAIDPKGDLGNLMLAFPNLAPTDFRPWIDESEAARRQMSPDEFAASQAELWRSGLAQWDEAPDRIQRFCDAVDRVIYTPGSNAGIPVTVLKSFHAPPPELVADAEALNERIASAASGLLALLGIDADPVRSREHIFLSNVLNVAWRAGQDLDLRQMIQNIQRPPFDKVGVIDLESFYPAADRSKLAMSLNNLLASPSFATWLEGVPLEIANMLYTPEGRPRLAIFSIAHLDEAQRMFFVTILLNEVLAWIRTQPGTSSLRALLYMDEVFGYFPPIGNPPAKRPMLTLLKQARAYGLGCVLATQNPVDLDYKGLSNAGTWFLGRLQTERDKSRVIEGLEGASAQAGASFNRREMEATLAALGNRVFLMNNVHEDAPVVFHTRWALSYLAGPLTREQIKRLMDPVRTNYVQISDVPINAVSADAETGAVTAASNTTTHRPILPANIREVFLPVNERVPDGYQLEYRPGLLGKGKVHFVRKSYDIDLWRNCFVLQTIHDTPTDNVWEGAYVYEQDVITQPQPEAAGRFADLPSEFARDKSYGIFARHLRDHLYRSESLTVWKCGVLDHYSQPGEEQADYRSRLVLLLEERFKVERDKLEQAKNANREKVDRKIADAQTDLRARRWSFFARLGAIAYVVIDWFAQVFLKNGLPGRRRSLNPALSSAATESSRQSKAKNKVEAAEKEREQLERDYEEKTKSLEARFNPNDVVIEQIDLKPQKGDIAVDMVSLAWLPWRVDAAGRGEPVY